MKGRKMILEELRNVEQDTFDSLALSIYAYQFNNNPVYKRYVELLAAQRGPIKPTKLEEIPFLPISFFKSDNIQSGIWDAEVIYTSSSTTGTIPSKHFVKNKQIYLASSLSIFEEFYGNIENYVILALLPGYLERKGSSLVAMADYFIKSSKSEHSGFYLNDHRALLNNINEARAVGKKILLLGVSFALWELAEKKFDLHDVIVMETGGMKGRGPELPKAAFHEFLKTGLNVEKIHSEYGMTELLSQAYSKGETIFELSKSMRILTRDITDPFSYTTLNKAGVINIIDLMNLDSCSFIATDDLGMCLPDNKFQILGRLDHSEMRGCNLLVSDL